MDLDHYCRDIEAYLCRKNDGHLIRIAGPAFERVSQWAEQGIPLKVAFAGIDRYFERYYRRGPRRRPVRIEFCEADVLDAFDDWRRAVGVPRDEPHGAPGRGGTSLVAHVERTIARLTALRASSVSARSFDATLDRVIRELDQLTAAARKARGAARDSVLSRLEALDRELVDAAVDAADEALRARADADARQQLSAFRERMPREAYDRSVLTAVERHICEHFALPSVRFA